MKNMGWTGYSRKPGTPWGQHRDRAVNPTFPASTSSLAFLICSTTQGCRIGFLRSAILKGLGFPGVSRKLLPKLWVVSATTGPGPVSGGRNSSPIPAFSQPIALDGAKLGMEASCPEAPWPCAVPNAAPAQNRLAKILRAAVRFFALLIGENADIDGLLIFGFYLTRHAWRKNVSGIVQGYCRFSRIKVDFAPLGVSDLTRSRR